MLGTTSPNLTDRIFMIPKGVVIRDILMIVSGWCLSLCIINPLGNFPLNDDWSYGLTVKHFIENGEFRPTGNTAMPLLTNVLWGSLFCVPKGFSFTALRVSTLVASIVSIVTIYLLIRNLCQPRWLALVACLTLVSNPIYYALLPTFMTDVLYIAITVAAALFFAQSLSNESKVDLIIGTALSVMAVLSRQLAISLPVAFGLCLIVKQGFKTKNILRAITPMMLCAGALLAFQHWLAVTGRLPAEYAVKTVALLETLSSPKRFAVSFVKNSFVALLYLGLFLMPVLAFAIADALRCYRKQVIGMTAITIAGLMVGLGAFAILGLHPAVTAAGDYAPTYVMPMSGNILMKSGIGPLMLPDNWQGAKYVPVLPEYPAAVWLIVTAISVLGAAFLITVISVRVVSLCRNRSRGVKSTSTEISGIFLLVSVLVYLLPLVASSYIDRYLLPPVPLLAGAIACLSTNSASLYRSTAVTVRSSAAVVLAAFAVLSICGVRDYLTWNQLRWNAIKDVVGKDHVKVTDIDGGLEFNGWYMYTSDYEYNSQKSWWWVQGNTYMVTFSDMPGYKVVREYSYSHWVPPHIGTIKVLKRVH